MDAAPPRPAPGALAPGWADKSDELLVRKPLHQRGWFRRLMLTLLLITVVTGTAGGLLLLRWHRQQQAEFARQRQNLEVFLRSPAFEAFAHELDMQLVATLNFAVQRPAVAASLLPEIAAAERTRRQLPWAIELLPLHTSAADHPTRVGAAMRAAADLLARRGFDFAGRSAEARTAFLRLLDAHARAFLTDHPAQEFPILALDRDMQRTVLGAYAARGGGTVAEAEQALIFFSVVGPALWREIQGAQSHAGFNR